MNLIPLDLADAWSLHTHDGPSTAVVRFRDLLLTRQGELVTVIACDSNAGIGNLPADLLYQSARLTGYSATKVPLMEVLAAGAIPIVIVNTLGVALHGPGREILAGVEDCARQSGHSPVITGSDETNVKTTQTSVGITVVGVAPADQLLLGMARAGDDVFVIGRPMDGFAVPYNETDPAVVTPHDIGVLVAMPNVHEVLPVGSRGVRHEANELARTAGLTFTETPATIDMTSSAGSSTCVLVACPPGERPAISALVTKPVTRIGALRPRAFPGRPS